MNVQQMTKALRVVDRELRRYCKEPRDRVRLMGVLSQQYIEEFREEQGHVVPLTEHSVPSSPEDQERETPEDTTDPITEQPLPF